MASKTSTIQTIYEFCKMTFPLTGTPPSSAQAVQKLCSLLDTVNPADVGLKEEIAEDDRGYGLSTLNPFNRVARWAQPITYLDIHECHSFTMCIFCFPTSSVIPLHDHPGMTVFSKLLYGSLHVKAYDWIEPPQIKSIGPDCSQVRLAKSVVDRVLTTPCGTRVLYPTSGGNLHCFTAVTPCAVLDILTPPYLEEAGRKCTYYHDYPYSSFATEEGVVKDGREEEYAWLAEIEAPNISMRSGVTPALLFKCNYELLLNKLAMGCLTEWVTYHG